MPALTRNDARIDFDWSDAPPPQGAASIEWTGQIVPRVGGEQVLKVRADGAVRVSVNGVDIANNGEGLPIVAGIPPTIPVSGRVTLAAGVSATVQVRYVRKPGYGIALGAFGGVQLSWAALQPTPELSHYDAVVIAAGLGAEYEGEGFDRPFAMPEYQATMIANVAAANPRTIAVIHAGGVDLSEFAQVYVGQDNPRVARSMKEFKGFAKVSLAPGQRQRVTVALNPRAFAYFDDQRNTWIIDAAQFRIGIGAARRMHSPFSCCCASRPSSCRYATARPRRCTRSRRRPGSASIERTGAQSQVTFAVLFLNASMPCS